MRSSGKYSAQELRDFAGRLSLIELEQVIEERAKQLLGEQQREEELRALLAGCLRRQADMKGKPVEAGEGGEAKAKIKIKAKAKAGGRPQHGNQFRKAGDGPTLRSTIAALIGELGRAASPSEVSTILWDRRHPTKSKSCAAFQGTIGKLMSANPETFRKESVGLYTVAPGYAAESEGREPRQRPEPAAGVLSGDKRPAYMRDAIQGVMREKRRPMRVSEVTDALIARQFKTSSNRKNLMMSVGSLLSKDDKTFRRTSPGVYCLSFSGGPTFPEMIDAVLVEANRPMRGSEVVAALRASKAKLHGDDRRLTKMVSAVFTGRKSSARYKKYGDGYYFADVEPHRRAKPAVESVVRTPAPTPDVLQTPDTAVAAQL